MKRLKKILIRSGIILGVLASIILIANACFVWITGSRLEGQLEQIRNAGEPLTLADLARKPIPSEENAATFLRRAEADVSALDKEFTNVRSISEYPGFLMSAEDRKTVKAGFSAYPKVIPLLEQAAACPDYDAQLDYTLPTEFVPQILNLAKKNRDFIRVLAHRADLFTAEGNRDEAVRTALVIFQLARHFDRNPTIINFLVVMACRNVASESVNAALQTGPISKEVRKALDTELALQESMKGYHWAVKSERAFVLDSFISTIPHRNFWLFSRGYWNMQESACLEALQSFLRLTVHPGTYRQAEKTIREMQQKTRGLSNLVCSGIISIHEAAVRNQALIRSLRVLNALQARTPADNLTIPKIEDLGLPTETTTDPFTGKPLHVKRLPEGWLVYSVGRNLQDDGGALTDLKDVGVGPPPPAAKPAEK